MSVLLDRLGKNLASCFTTTMGPAGSVCFLTTFETLRSATYLVPSNFWEGPTSIINAGKCTDFSIVRYELSKSLYGKSYAGQPSNVMTVNRASIA